MRTALPFFTVQIKARKDRKTTGMGPILYLSNIGSDSMNKELKEHYLKTGRYTYSGLYADYLRSLPDDINEIGELVCSSIIHRITLAEGNTNANYDLRYGDMDRYPWHRMRCEDDVFLTAVSMLAELFRLDSRGLVRDRLVENKLVLCCRYVSVLMASALKAKGIPCRCRAGFAPYFNNSISMDHWIDQYYSDEKARWVTIDADGFYDREVTGFDQYDIPADRFDWAGETWLKIRNGQCNGSRYVYADGLGTSSLKAVIRYLLYDFHAIMNNELTFSFTPSFIDNKFDSLTEDSLRDIDHLARLMTDPDSNYDELKYIWNNKRKYRVINSPLVGDQDNRILL